MANVHEATVADIRTLARGVVEWRLALPESLKFRPGQFVSVRVGQDQGGAAVLRSYSIASSPDRKEISLILKLVEGGVGTAWFERLRIGDPVRFTGPMGFFVLDLQHTGDVVFGATGVGITPVLPMMQELLERNEPGRVTLYWGNRSHEDLFWRDELAALQARHERLQVRLYLSKEAPADWTGERGRITPAVLADLPTMRDPVFYLVGNGAMIRELKGGLVERGVNRKKQIRNEAFFQ